MKELKTHRVNLKLTDTEYMRMCSLMEQYEYISVSRFWRDLLNEKRLATRRCSGQSSERAVRNAMNRMTDQIVLIGKRYNQVASRLEESIAQGAPRTESSARSVDVGLEALQRLTEKLRDDVAACIAMVEGMTWNSDKARVGHKE